MKTHKSNHLDRILKATRVMAGAIAVVGATNGCTHHASRIQHNGERLREESRALTTAVVEALQSQPAPERDAYTLTALEFAKQDQRVEGLPLQPFDVPALLGGMGITNCPATALIAPAQFDEAREEVAERFEIQNKLLAALAKEESALVQMGAQAEASRNQRITRWTKFSLGTFTFLGGAIALFVFFPVAIPVAGRFLGWLVGKLPGLANACGVVSVKAFDAVVRAIEKTKQQSSGAAPTVPVANAFIAPGDSRRGPSEDFVESLQTQLSREMDAAHKALVRARKTQLA